MRNPAMMQEMMRNQDRAMSNLEVCFWASFLFVQLNGNASRIMLILLSVSSLD